MDRSTPSAVPYAHDLDGGEFVSWLRLEELERMEGDILRLQKWLLEECGADKRADMSQGVVEYVMELVGRLSHTDAHSVDVGGGESDLGVCEGA